MLPHSPTGDANGNVANDNFHAYTWDSNGRPHSIDSATLTFDALGRMVRGVADNNASLLLNYNFKDGDLKGLTLNAGINYTSKRAGDVPAANFTALGVVEQVSFYLKPQYVDMLAASYRLNSRVTLRLNINNVFDQKDYIAVAGARFWGAGLTTATGRNIRFTTTYKF